MGHLPGFPESRYYALTQSAADAIVSADSAGGIVGWNRAAERIFGYSEAEVLGRPLTMLMPARLAQQHSAGMARLRAGDGTRILGKTVELTGLTKAGAEFPMDLSLSEWQVPEGRFFTGIIRDITERKKLEALRESEKKYRGIYQSLQDVYVEAALDGTIVDVSPQIEDLSRGQMQAGDVIGRPTVLYYADPRRRDELLKALAQHGRVKDFEAGFRNRDGTIVPLSVSAVLECDASGRPLRISATLRDISERKAAEAEIRNYVRQLETEFMQTVELAMTLSEMRDPYTAGHERRVASIATAIGSALGWSARRVEGLKIAGYLHDIGKLAIPAEILAKPIRLSAAEYELVKAHPRAGYDAVKRVSFPWPVADTVLQHHERLDGSGYPQGLAGDRICVEARVLAVADVVEAMASHRPYRAALGVGAALDEIIRGRGALYDAEAVDACVRLFRKEGYTIPG